MGAGAAMLAHRPGGRAQAAVECPLPGGFEAFRRARAEQCDRGTACQLIGALGGVSAFCFTAGRKPVLWLSFRTGARRHRHRELSRQRRKVNKRDGSRRENWRPVRHSKFGGQADWLQFLAAGGEFLTAGGSATSGGWRGISGGWPAVRAAGVVRPLRRR